MKVNFGDQEVLFSKTILFPKEEDLWLEVDIDDWNAKIKLSFSIDEDNKKPHFSMSSEDDHAHFHIRNWDSLGVCFSKPAQFGNVNGKSAFLMLYGSLIGTVRKIDAQVSVGSAS